MYVELPWNLRLSRDHHPIPQVWIDLLMALRLRTVGNNIVSAHSKLEFEYHPRDLNLGSDFVHNSKVGFKRALTPARPLEVLFVKS